MTAVDRTFRKREDGHCLMTLTWTPEGKQKWVAQTQTGEKKGRSAAALWTVGLKEDR